MKVDGRPITAERYAIITATLILLSMESGVVRASGATLNITVVATRKGAFLNFDFASQQYPVYVRFILQANLTATSYLWQFGDGTNSTTPSPSHYFSAACIYNVNVTATAANGTSDFGALSLGIFDRPASPYDLELCPPQGTAGFTPVELDGGYFGKQEKINVFMNGTSIDNVTTNFYGSFELPVNSSLTPEVNGTAYVFTTKPFSLARVFTTLEGIRGTPASGVPGDTATVEGRSYPAYATESIYLGTAYVTQAQADGSGSFTASYSVPATPPLTTIGTYIYSTSPDPVLGTGASFTITANTLVSEILSWWWLIILVVAAILAYYIRRRMRQRALKNLQHGGAHQASKP